jgi:DNA polymerase III delta prime subunit
LDIEKKALKIEQEVRKKLEYIATEKGLELSLDNKGKQTETYLSEKQASQHV